MDSNRSTKIKEWIFVTAAFCALVGAVLSFLKFAVHVGSSSKPKAGASSTYLALPSPSLTSASAPLVSDTLTPPTDEPTDSSTSPTSPPSTTASPPPQYISVDLTDLCNSPNATLLYNVYQCAPRNTVIGSTDFTWDIATPANIPASTGFNFSATSCRSITLHFAFEPNGYEPGLKATMSVVQEGPPSQSVAVTTNTKIYTLHAKLNGGPWAITGLANRPNLGPWAVFTSGTAQCTTADGS
jgi:hypothetical protein